MEHTALDKDNTTRRKEETKHEGTRQEMQKEEEQRTDGRGRRRSTQRQQRVIDGLGVGCSQQRAAAVTNNKRIVYSPSVAVHGEVESDIKARAALRRLRYGLAF